MKSALDGHTADQLIEHIRVLCHQAGQRIMQHFHLQATQPIYQTQKNDQSPLTQADIDSHHLLVNALGKLTPEVPIISEENESDHQEIVQERLNWPECWLIDPLDGTAEFLDQSEEFTINLAFIAGSKPILGAIYHPPSETLYIGGSWLDGSWKLSQNTQEKLTTVPINQRIQTQTPLKLLGSRRHGIRHWDGVCQQLEENLHQVEEVKCGSALKFCLLAEGKADLYARFGATSEWDTAAGQAILMAVGGQVYTHNFDELRYNAKPSLINPEFFAVADSSFDWRLLLLGALNRTQRQAPDA